MRAKRWQHQTFGSVFVGLYDKRHYHTVMDWSEAAAFHGDYDLNTFDGLWQAAQVLFTHEDWPRKRAMGGRRGPLGKLFCPQCGGERRMFFSELYVAYDAFYTRMGDGGIQKPAELYKGRGLLHAVFALGCAQCDATFIALLYESPAGNSLCILPSTYGGPATPNSPDSIKFYCDQASRAASVGAYTAALAMLRPAVDIVLELQGYQKKWLGDKLAELEKDINAGSGHRWTMQYDCEFLVALKKLANDALHTRAADIKTLSEIQDETLYRHSEIAVAQLLDVIYERPERDQRRLAKLKDAALSGGPK
jgi:hypothetical protein